MCYIHGKAQEDATKTNIIIGINDDLTDGKENQDFTFVRFKKYFQRIINKTGSEYKNWLNISNTSMHDDVRNTSTKLKRRADKLSREINQIHIVGHSLAETDFEILYEILSKNNFKIFIYYYSQKDFENKVQQTIKILSYKGKNGKDELIRRVHGDTWSIKFVDQYDEKEGLFIHKDKRKLQVKTE